MYLVLVALTKLYIQDQGDLTSQIVAICNKESLRQLFALQLTSCNLIECVSYLYKQECT